MVLLLRSTMPRAEVKQRAGDFVAVDVLPGGKQKEKHTSSGHIWYGKLAKDVVHIHRQAQKKPGSTKLKTFTTPQDPRLSMRYLEVSEIEPEAGTLYEWHDGDHGGTGFVDEACPQIKLHCCALWIFQWKFAASMMEYTGICCRKRRPAA